MVSTVQRDGSLSGRRVLVTGADGFIGSHLVERLVRDDVEVRALCLYTSQGTHGWLDESPDEVRDAVDLRLGDVRDAGLMRDLVDGCDLVLHLASLIAIPYSYVAPASFVETNITGALNLLEAVRASGARMINTSTSEVYGTPETVPITESHPLRAQSPYAASKIAADKLCESYAASYGVEVATLRPFNTYGPRQSMRAVIPTVLTQLLAGAETIRLGNLNPKRDFTFVSDTVEGFVRAATAGMRPGELVQLGTGRAVSVGEVVELCREVTGNLDAEVLVEDERIRPEGSEVEVLLSDPASARDRFGWTPSVELEGGLRATAAWIADRRPDPSAAARYVR
jgi:NAD dependent epimerase/dehydratase